MLVLPAPVLITIAGVVVIVALFSAAANIAGRAALKRQEAERRRAEERAQLIRDRAVAVKGHRQEIARKEKQEAQRRASALATAKREQEEKARAEEKKRVDSFGKPGAALVKRARSAAQRIVSTEAAREGWLGDVDFAPDIEEIEANLLKALALQRKADELSALPKPDDDDRKLVAEAKATVAQLDRRTKKRVELLEKCACEAQLIDESLREEREDARLAAKREELHGELAAMLYGIEAESKVSDDSAADTVMARVQAYREIKGQIERARDDGADGPAADAADESGDSTPWMVAPFVQAWRWVVE